MSKHHDGMEEIVLKEEQISFVDGELVDDVAKAEIPIAAAVVEETPELTVETVAAPVEVVEIDEVVEQPMAVVEEPVYTEVAPVIAEAVEPVKHAVWPWALGALALAGLATALAWPHTPTQVAEPVVTPAPAAVRVVETPAPEVHKATTPIPTCDGGQLVVKDSTDVFATASETGTLVTTLTASSPVTVTAVGEDGWFPVTAGTAHGYVPTTAISCLVTVTG